MNLNISIPSECSGFTKLKTLTSYPSFSKILLVTPNNSPFGSVQTTFFPCIANVSNSFLTYSFS